MSQTAADPVPPSAPAAASPAAAAATRPRLSVEEQIARGMCPIKHEYVAWRAPRVAAGAVNSGGAAAPKSKAQQKSEEKARKAQMCNAFALGRCQHGEHCKWSHDIEAYLRAKQDDLPGVCPFVCTGACPYGVSCRWLSTHKHTGPFDDVVAKVRAEVHVAKENAASAGETGEPVHVGASGSGASPRHTAANGASADIATGGTTNGAGGAEAAAKPLPFVEVVPPTKIEPPMNSMSREVQQALWKRRYDFGRADGVLKSLGIRIQQRGGGGEKKGGKQGGKQSGKSNGGGGGGGDGGDENAAAAAAGGSGDGRPDATNEIRDSGGEAPLAPAAASNEPGSGAAAAGNGDAPPSAPVPALTVATPPAPADSDAAAVAALSNDSCNEGPPAPKRHKPDTDAPANAAPPPPCPAAARPAACLASLTCASAAPAGACGAEAAALHRETALRPCERKLFDVRGKTYLAPLTTVGNLPFRRVCKGLGADVTVGEMALATNLLQGNASEWALLKRHPCEDFFGVQVCGGFADSLARVSQLIDENATVDFVDINMGCPIDLVCDRAAGSSLLLRPRRIEEIAKACSRVLSVPLTLKTRKGYYDDKDVTHTFVGDIRSWGAVALTLHGRTRQQRYSRQADWQYIRRCAELAEPTQLQLIGNGDVYSFEDWNEAVGGGGVSTAMIGRGALIKPWLFTEIKEQRHWDISSSERLEILRKFVAAGLEHWGSDERGVETTRRFLLEWLSYLCRYVPVGLLEVLPNKLHWRPPAFFGRNDLETLMASDCASDWVRLSEMLLGPVPPGFTFSPKHKSAAYSTAVPKDGAPGSGAGAAGVEEDQEQG